MKKTVFRKVALERLSSPEQLDRMITVTNTKLWLILTALGCILTSIVIWSITGSLATSVTANGMLVKGGGIVDISSSEIGQISDIRARAGDIIKKGDIVARLDQKEIVDEITALSDLLPLHKENKENENDRKALEKQIEELRKRLVSSSYIVSHIDGRVVEVKLNAGDMVSQGTPVLSVAKEGAAVKNLIAVIYVPVEYGKSLAPGMETRVSPSTVKKEEFGYILGRIVSVSEYPATVHTARERLGSSELAQAYAGSTACLEVIVDLVSDNTTKSGYKWSTLSGPPISIENGTACSAAVVVERLRPIEMVIPQFRNLAGREP
ncbi:MAG: NHLP bacteriocin system secretion protein [Clostridiales bacterium]|nr:NHLP bacteriocin system secretion protein [Clostridiales bacterium]